MEQPVQFPNSQGQELRGILHTPPDRSRLSQTGVVILNSGVGQRNYSHNLYVGLARRLSSEGYPVLRFDFHGVGESGGEFERAKFIKLYNDIQNGLFVPDTESAVEFLKRECHPEQTVLLGICGGAITALIAAARFPDKVSAAVLIGLPITLDSADRPYQEELTTAQAKLTLLEYVPKLFSLRAWGRLLTFRSDIGVMIRSLFIWAGKLIVRPRRSSSDNWARLVTHPDFNPHVIPSFIACLKRRQKLSLIFAECDRLRWEFESEFQEKCLGEDTEFFGLNELVVVPEANHEFQFTESKQRLFDVISGWLARNSPA